jgi:phage repressor protein C with HTH and peptisase S24 domain
MKKQLATELSEEIAQACTYPYLGKIACAGTGFYFDDIPTDTIKAPYVEGADFIIGVSGESMEPDYHDGEKLFVRKVEYLRNGDVGIFTIGNQCFLKELGEDGLISRNKNYDDIPGDEKVRLIGKVIGKVE